MPAAGDKTGELTWDELVVVAEGAKRQESQVGEGQGELLCCVAHTEVAADTVAGHQFCSAILDGGEWASACLLTYLSV